MKGLWFLDPFPRGILRCYGQTGWVFSDIYIIPPPLPPLYIHRSILPRPQLPCTPRVFRSLYPFFGRSIPKDLNFGGARGRNLAEAKRISNNNVGNTGKWGPKTEDKRISGSTIVYLVIM